MLFKQGKRIGKKVERWKTRKTRKNLRCRNDRSGVLRPLTPSLFAAPHFQTNTTCQQCDGVSPLENTSNVPTTE